MIKFKEKQTRNSKLETTSHDILMCIKLLNYLRIKLSSDTLLYFLIFKKLIRCQLSFRINFL